MRAAQGDLPSRIVALIPSLDRPTSSNVRDRLPARLQANGDPAIARAQAVWEAEVGALLALHAAKERCEALGLLVLLRYMPLHHTALPALDPLNLLLVSANPAYREASELLSMQSTSRVSNSTPSALRELIVGKESSTITQLLATLAPLLSPPESPLVAPSAGRADDGASDLSAWEERAQILAVLVLMAAMHGEQDFCQLQQPVIARTEAATRRHAETTKTLLEFGRAAVAGRGSLGRSTLGALLITWCVVILEVAPEAEVSEVADELNLLGCNLQGLAWGLDLLRTRGFRHDDPPEELSNIARHLHFDLVAAMLSQQRFRNEDALDDASGAVDAAHAWDKYWPAHSEPLALLMAAVVEGRPALCRLFWSFAESLAEGTLGSLLVNARYPAHEKPLTALLAALCADADSATRAWRFAHQLPRVCLVGLKWRNVGTERPRQGQELTNEKLSTALQHKAEFGKGEWDEFGIKGLRIDNYIKSGASFLQPDARGSMHLPAQTVLLCSEETQTGEVLVEWAMASSQPMDIAPYLADAVSGLLRAGTSASESVQRTAAASLSLLAHAPEAHKHSALLQFMPPLSDLVDLLPLCARLASVARDSTGPPLLLLTLKLLTALAPVVPQPLAALLQGCPLLWSEASWLPEHDHAQHASMLLQLLHVLAAAAALPTMPDAPQTAPLVAAHHFVVAHVLPAREGVRASRIKRRAAHLKFDHWRVAVADVWQVASSAGSSSESSAHSHC